MILILGFSQLKGKKKLSSAARHIGSRIQHRIQKLLFLHLFTDLFRKDFSPLVRINRSYFRELL